MFWPRKFWQPWSWRGKVLATKKRQNPEIAHRNRTNLENLVLLLAGVGELGGGQVRQGGQGQVDLVRRRDCAQWVGLGSAG
jgi:hypothetical protein